MTASTYLIPPWAQGEITDADIKRLARREDDLFIVFINSDDEVDWVTSPAMNVKVMGDEVLADLINSTQSQIQLSYNKIPDYIDKTSRIYALLVDILAEAVVCSLYRNKDLVIMNLKNFDDRINSYLGQYVRGLILEICAYAFLATVFLLFLTKLNEMCDLIDIFKDYSMIGYSLYIGVFGAIFSIVMKSTQIGTDFFDEHLIIKEIIAKIIAGGMAGCILYFFMKGKFILFSPKEDIEFLCFSFLAGFSERFIPDILAKKKAD